MAKRQTNTVSLDDLVTGKLPDRVLAAIAEMQLTVEEVGKWERGKPAVRVSATTEELVLDVRIRVPIRRVLAVLGAAVGAALGATRFLARYGPALRDLLDQVPFGI